MYDNDKREKSIEQTFLSRALIDNSKSRICYKDIREKYFGYEITAVKQAKIEAARREAERIEAAKLEAARLEAERIAALNNVEEGDMMKNNELEKFVVETPSSEPVVVELTEKEKAKLLEKERKALEKQKEKERLAKEKEKQKEKERLAREKEKQKEKERLAREKEKQKEKERLAREKEKLKEKERLAKEKQKEKERLAKEKEKQRELEKKQKAEEKKRLAQEAAASAHTAKMTFETEEQPIKDVVQSMEIEDVVQEENEVQEEYIPVDSKPMTFEEMLAKKKKDDNKPTEIPSDNLARLRQRMEANRKLEQGIVEQDSKKAQAIEESKNKLKAMNNIAYEEETTDDLYQLIDDLEAKVQELEDLNKELTEQVESLESEIKQLTAEDSGNLAVVVDKLDKQLDDKNEELERKERLIEDLKAELNEAKDEIAELEANALDAKVVDKLQEQIDNLEEENEELQVNVDELTANEEELQAKIAELVQKIQDSQDVQKMESLEEENAKLKEEVQRLTDECSLYKEQIEVLQASEISKQEEIDNLNKDLEAYEKQAKEAIEKLALAEGVVVKESGFGVDVTIDELNEKIAFIKEQLADEKVLEENSEEEKEESLEQEANEEAEEVTLEQEANEEAEEVAVEQEASDEAEEVAVEQVASEEVQEECSDVAEEEPLEFNELISLIHTRRQEVIDKMLADKEEYQKDSLLNKDALEKALSEYTEVKSHHDELDDEYKNEIEAGALTEEEYLEKVQEIANEEEIIEIQISERKEEEKAYSDKFEETLDNSETEIITLCRQELEAIEVYLNKLNEEYAEKEDKYQEYSEEKYALLKQLDDLNVSYLQLKLDICQSRAIILDNLKNSEEVLERIADEEYVENRREKIASQIALKNKEYDRLLNKINKIKEHQEKRIKSEKVLRITDEAIVRYNDVLTDFETFSLRYQTNDEVLGILKQELAGLNPEEDKEAIESLNSKIMNVEILQNDISDKINYFKEVKESLEEDDKVSYYIRLLKSMEQLKVKNIEFRVQANNVKSRINELNEELESLK